MQRITTLLDKIKELAKKPDTHAIDIDLMMDYTKVLYADLMEWRSKVSFRDNLSMPSQPAVKPTVAAPTPPPPPAAPRPEIRTMEENMRAGEAKPEITAPPVELETPTHYTAPKEERSNSTAKITSYPDIRRSIGINDKYQFISELFGNDKDAYEQVLDKINICDTEEEAVAWIRSNAATAFQWVDEDEAVQYFYTTLNDYFLSR